MGTEEISRPPARDASRWNAIVQSVADALRNSRSVTNFGALLASASISPDEVTRELGSDEALVAAVAGTIAQGLIAPLAESPTLTSFNRQLVEFSRRAAHEYSGLRMKTLYRILAADTTREPAIKSAMYRNGPELVRRDLARFFSSAQAAGVGLEVDSRQLATCFMAFLRSHWDLSDMSGAVGRTPCDGEVGKLVEVFLSGIQTETMRA